MATTTSAVFGTRLVPSVAAFAGVRGKCGGTSSPTVGIECSSRPQKKATKHHMKTRPRKTQPWDINRKPTVRTPLPPLPPDWTLVEAAVPAPPEVPDASG
ncbi:hypothetical protein MLD38_034497 [Melastoma candidum]|uniref:Uncharacterized protein n=1 Tax=Melastoma candidum TaxID=119954 RepID=A0ACB9MDR9_9MYRT|nr:hypothetical protein MLD38_034497 [Melastoma candidum]